MKIIVKLQGGLGNQMFQYAFGKEISLLTNRKLILDLSTLNENNINVVKRDFDLEVFNIFDYEVVDFFDGQYEKISEIWSPESWSSKYFSKIKQEIINSQSENIYIDGYWQSPILFSEKFDLHKEFSFKHEILENSKLIFDEIKNTNSVMLNIRRKDFVNNNFHGWYGIDFVNKSIEFLQSNENDLRFFIFSDDIDWCKNNLSFIDNSVLIDHSNSGSKFSNYLLLMKSCKHFIIPNSTFAYWACLLNQNEYKIIVRPKIWFQYKNLECDFLFESLNYNKIACKFY